MNRKHNNCNQLLKITTYMYVTIYHLSLFRRINYIMKISKRISPKLQIINDYSKVTLQSESKTRALKEVQESIVKTINGRTIINAFRIWLPRSMNNLSELEAERNSRKQRQHELWAGSWTNWGCRSGRSSEATTRLYGRTISFVSKMVSGGETPKCSCKNRADPLRSVKFPNFRPLQGIRQRSTPAVQRGE